ncbi:MAG: S-methyl-5-thioribose-1-phosphate isomerase [Bacteroidales bacterium]|nr:S-methyl-5-thioribose-1-phosphate isomerase [Bacteroidales bacterium]
MKVNGKHYLTIWMEGSTVYMIDQTLLPFEFRIFEAKNYRDTCKAISAMIVRGAGAIGVAAGFAMAQACMEGQGGGYLDYIQNARKEIEATRPTARNLFYATERVFNAALKSVESAIREAIAIAEENIQDALAIGKYGQAIIPGKARIATQCNAGWLGFVDHGSALSVVYAARDAGKVLFVYVNETRPRSQGARLTAWELHHENIPHTIIADNACAYFAASEKIDLFVVGADRIARNGDTANKIGTLDKAIIAKEFGIPFYVAAPLSTFDVKCQTGKDIPIEERDEDEVLFQSGTDAEGVYRNIRVSNPGSHALNPAFDVTPAGYITGIITEKGIIKPIEEEIVKICNA